MSDQFVSMIFHQAWQIAALTIVVALIVRIAARNRPYLAHALWVLVLIKCVTPPLWGHSLGVFSQLLAWTTSAEVPDAEVMSAVDTPADLPPVEAIEHVELVVPEDVVQVLVPHDVWPGDAEFSFDAEAQRQRNAEEQEDLASLGLNDSALEIPPLESEAEIHATEQPSSSAIDQLPSLLFGGFLIGSIITLMTMVIRCLRCLRQIHLHQTTEFDDLLRDRIQQLAKRLHIRRIPNIIVSDVLFGPAVLGLLRHTIVLPRCLFEGRDFVGWAFLPVVPSTGSTLLDDRPSGQSLARCSPFNETLGQECPSYIDRAVQDLQFLDPILAHELLHIRRGDLRTGTLQAIAQSLWWFHPAVWFCNRWLSREAERCCDEQVIAELGCTPAHYARSLLSVIECKHRLQPIPVFPGMKPVEITSQRMERIMSLKNGLKKRTPIWCWLMIAALAIVVLPGAVAKSTPDEVKPDSKPPVAATATGVETDESKSAGTETVESPTQTKSSLEELTDPIPAPDTLPDWIRNSSDPLVKLVWDARNISQRRLLMTDQRTPWQFMNGLAALRREFLIREGEEAVVGLDWLQTCRAFPGQPWFQKTEFGGHPNPEPAPVWFDNHAEQLIAILAMNDVPLDATFATADGTITVGDIVKHLQMTVNEKKLTSWTLIALSKYLSRNEKWSNADGETWSIERLVQIELDKPNDTATWLSLMSLAVARSHYYPAGETLEGTWLKADQRILAAIEKSKPKQTSDGRIITTYAPNFQSPHFQYRSRFSPRNPTQKSAQTDLEQAQLDLEEKQRVRLAAFPTDIESTNRAQMLLFLTLALPVDQLGKDWIRRELETAANELVADWSDQEVRSPFYETTQALTVYLERYPRYLEYVSEAGLSPVLAGNNHVHVRVKGMVRQPSSYGFVGNSGVRLLELITKAGGPSEESADSVIVIRKAGNQPQPIILQVNLQRLKTGADPDFYVMTGDEVLVRTADFVKPPLSASIRLDDNFVLSPETTFRGDMVIVFVNDKPITVEKMLGSAWGRLQALPDVSDSLKRQVICESIESALPSSVFQEIVLQYLDVDAGNLVSPERRQLAEKLYAGTDRMFQILKKSSIDGPEIDVMMRDRLAVAIATETGFEQMDIDLYVLRILGAERVASAKSNVTRHAQELVTTARLRSLVSMDYTNTTLAEVLRSVKKIHDIEIKVNSLHEQISQRIFDQPGAIDFHAETKPLGDALTAIISPFGLTLSLDGSHVLLQFADSERAMEKFRSLPGPPSFGVFGILRNPGWHPLTKEILLLDALAIAGDIENSDGVSIEITNPDILEGKAIPVSMSLKVLQNDKSGKLNRVVKDGDMINVKRSDSAEVTQAKAADRAKMQSKGTKDDSEVAGTFHIDEASSLQLRLAMAKRRNIELRMLKNATQLSRASSTSELIQLEREMRELELELENAPISFVIRNRNSSSSIGESGRTLWHTNQ